MWRFCLRQSSQHAETVSASTARHSPKTRLCARPQQLPWTRQVLVLVERYKTNAYNSAATPRTTHDKRRNQSPANFCGRLRIVIHICFCDMLPFVQSCICNPAARSFRQRQKRVGHVTTVAFIPYRLARWTTQRQRAKRQTERQKR